MGTGRPGTSVPTLKRRPESGRFRRSPSLSSAVAVVIASVAILAGESDAGGVLGGHADAID